MHYSVQYGDISDPANQRRAIIDLIKYIGIKRTKILMRAAPSCTYEQMSLYASFAGVRGFPVKALYDYARRNRDT